MFSFFSTPPFPTCYVFAVDNAHIKIASSLIAITENAMKLSASSYSIHLSTIDSESSDELMIRVSDMIDVAKVLKNVGKLRSFTTVHRQVLMMLSFEIGKLEASISAGDNVIVITESDSARKFFSNRVIKEARVVVIDPSTYIKLEAPTR